MKNYEKVIEVKIYFDDFEYLKAICDEEINKGKIKGYNIIENQTSFLWKGKKETKKNYVASTIISEKTLEEVLKEFDEEISKKWETPLIQVNECYVNKNFQNYLDK